MPAVSFSWLSRPLRERWLYVWVFLVFLLGETLSAALGIRFADGTLATLYQYLDERILREDLLSGLYYLHAQPPLFNLFLGCVLKLFPESASAAAAFSILFGVLALLVLLGTAWTMRRLRVSDPIAAVVTLGLGISPGFLVYRHWLFYTLPVAALLVAGAVSFGSYLESRSRSTLIMASVFTAAVMLTRSVFHPLWLVGLVAIVAWYVGRDKWRDVMLFASIPALSVGLWLGKNYIEFRSPSTSSWLGMSLAKRWPLSQGEIASLKSEGVIPPFWHRRAFQEPEELLGYGFFSAEAERDTHPAVDDPYRSNGEPNFNHRDYIQVSKAMLDGDLRLIQRYPGRYLQRVATAVLLFAQPGPNSVHFLVDYDFERVHRYRDALTTYVFLGRGSIERPIRMFAPAPNLLLVVIPLLLVVAFHGARREDSSRSGLLVYMLYSFLWVAVVANMVEIGENDRMRGEVEPFLAAFLGYGTTRVLRFFRGRTGVGTARTPNGA
jgi:hypothetical protein